MRAAVRTASAAATTSRVTAELAAPSSRRERYIIGTPFELARDDTSPAGSCSGVRGGVGMGVRKPEYSPFSMKRAAAAAGPLTIPCSSKKPSKLLKTRNSRQSAVGGSGTRPIVPPRGIPAHGARSGGEICTRRKKTLPVATW